MPSARQTGQRVDATAATVAHASRGPARGPQQGQPGQGQPGQPGQPGQQGPSRDRDVRRREAALGERGPEAPRVSQSLFLGAVRRRRTSDGSLRLRGLPLAAASASACRAPVP